MYIWREKVAGDVTADIVNTGLYPLDVVDGFKIRPGFFRMNGAYQTANGVSSRSSGSRSKETAG